ncbi:efflux RND transporter periplasmic adaptor subunit [Polaromonas sp. JS666]|uniref:efflux RND transporter periplasmic adaptor subunit n=1 Tax=Polaromonas sp. (strain JS666 / ATCC BAA-500) TaxID=296591 RepID=UPI0000464D14|nr:efflux RND transporter periplasmic adaptor subunit [Polaromonas sp. JS666]ABE45400.1 secretion protein HlyD [Polaromonas sp. JS666]
MNKKYLIAALLAAGVLGAAGYGLYTLGVKKGGTMPAASAPANAGSQSAAPAAAPQSVADGEEATRRHISAGLKAGDTDPITGSKILYYHDPMVPSSKFDKPAKSPFMDMMLVPVYASGDADQGKVTVSPRIQQNLGVRTATVTEGTLSPQVSAVGSIAYNERDQATVQARATGYVERLHVRATLDRVAKGQPLVDLYVPDWVAAQEEFLAIKRMQGNDLASLVDGARQRMRQAGMSDEQIRQVEASGRTQARITVTAPLGGVVVELMAREGMTVMAGTTLFRINGLSTVWANAEVPESQSALLRPGAKVQARSPAAPGTTFNGKVQAILPEVNPATRTLRARMELANPGARLVPGMFVSMQFMDMRAEKALLVPTEAVIQTGKRTVVMLAEENGRFRPVDVEAGIEAGGQTEIKRGLQAGQRVVVSSQFLIDSEASLKGVEARLNEAPKPVAGNTAPRHEGEAKIEAVGKDAITLSHGPIPSLKWGAMTMDFKSPPPQALPRNLEAGDRVSFEFYMDADGLPQLTRVSPLASAPGSTPASAGGKK